MKFIIDHDYHIHTKLSPCSGSKEQTPERILRYAEEAGYTSICLADHFWDSDVSGVPYDYRNLNYDLLSSVMPLPQSDGIKFLFGCEAEINPSRTIGVASENYDLFDFIVIPTTHLHMHGISVNEEDVKTLEDRANEWIKRFDVVLNSDLPFHKTGIAHLVCHLIAPKPYLKEDVLKIIQLIPSSEMERLFEKAAKAGIGIELNSEDMKFHEEDKDIILRPFRIAKECGCKFYLGSDAHSPGAFKGVRECFQRAIDLLKLEETDKFRLNS